MRHCLVITTYNNVDDAIGLIKFFNAKSLIFDCILIVDDCSTNDTKFFQTREFKKRYGNVEFIESSENFGGPGKSRNIGLQYAKSNQYDLLTFIDPDDQLSTDFFMELERLQNKYDNIPMFSFSSKKIRNAAAESEKDRLLVLNDFRYFNPLTLSGLTIKLSCFEYTEFSENKVHIAVEDYKFYMDSIINGNRIVQSSLPLINYGASGEHLSKNKWKMLRRFTVVNTEVFGYAGVVFRLFIFITRGLLKHRMPLHIFHFN